VGIAELAGRLPEPPVVARWAQALAVADAIMSPEWELRYFSFDAAWGDGEQLASMRNGQGDDWSITFSSAGAFLRGFDHECSLSPFASDPPRLDPRLLAGLPEPLCPLAEEVAFTLDDVPQVTLALWSVPALASWAWGREVDHDGGAWLFDELDGRPETYRVFAREYYEKDVPLEALRHVFEHRPLTEAVVGALNPEASLAELLGDVRGIGYPT